MFDIGATELLLIAIVAILVIGPKDMPMALRTAGRWIGKVRRVSGHFKSGVEAMIREAEMEEMDKKWKAQNEAIMAAHPPARADPPVEPIAAPETPSSKPDSEDDPPSAPPPPAA